MNPKVDPAALLLAVLAVAITTLTGPGAWSPTTTVSAAVVGVVVVTYTWPPSQRKHRNDPSQSTNFNYRAIIAQSTVYGFIFAIGIAWPWQQLLKSTDRATSWALISGLLLAIGAFICLSTLTNKPGFRWLNRSCEHIFRWLKRSHIFGWLNRRGANRRNDPSASEPPDRGRGSGTDAGPSRNLENRHSQEKVPGMTPDNAASAAGQRAGLTP